MEITRIRRFSRIAHMQQLNLETDQFVDKHTILLLLSSQHTAGASVRVNGWVGGWVGRWLGDWMSGWVTDGWVEMAGWMDEWVAGWLAGWVGGYGSQSMDD